MSNRNMRLTLVGDLHAKNDNLEKIGAIFDLIEKLGHDVILLGDVFHTKEVIRGKCLNYVFERISNSRHHFYILVGNHDWFNLECTEHSLELFKQLKNVDVIDRPQSTNFIDTDILNDEPSSGNETQIGFLPYYHNLESFREALKKIDGNRVLIMHQGITGFDYGNGHIAEKEVGFEELASLELVISGHFHKYQRRENLVYLGTPFSHDFGESNQEKFLGILDTETLKLELLSTNLPRHITLEVNCDSDPENTLRAQDGVGLSDIVRVVLTGTEENVQGFDKSRFPSVKFIERPTGQFANLDAVSETDSNPKKFLTWALNVKNLDEDTLNLGLQILEEADV